MIPFLISIVNFQCSTSYSNYTGSVAREITREVESDLVISYECVSGDDQK